MTKIDQLKELQAKYEARPFFRVSPPSGRDYLNIALRGEWEAKRKEWQENNPELYAEEQSMMKAIGELKDQIHKDEQDRAKKEKALKESGVSKRDLEVLAVAQETTAIKAVREWVKGQSGFLLISGVHNSGKTIAAIEALRLSIEADNNFHGGYMRFIRAVDIMRWLSFRDDETLTRLERCKTGGFLVIDGLGTEYTNDMMRQALFDVMDSRHGKNYRTVLTSTLPPAAIKGVESFESVYGPACMSRIKRNGKILVLKDEVEF